MELNDNPATAEDRVWVQGSCHCGNVRFEVNIERTVSVQHCNCSICQMTGFIHLIVPGPRFRLISGLDSIRDYRFNTGTARHYFCTNCGVKSFYVPRSNPDGYSINLRCLKLPPGFTVLEEQFDGRNWEENAERLRHLSEPEGTGT